jgi:hypothetical protein
MYNEELLLHIQVAAWLSFISMIIFWLENKITENHGK